MSDASNGTAAPSGTEPLPHHTPFPLVRLLYSVAYGFIAWLVIHILFLVAAIQFVIFAMHGRANAELKSFALSLVQYEWELVAYITFVRDEQPFPFGPFPKHA